MTQGLNNSINNALPEGVSITLTPAGISVRTKAYLFDFLIRALVMLVFGFVFSFMGKAGQGILLVLYFIISWGYYIVFESLNGQTPGKKRYKLQVVQDNGLPCKLPNIVLRNLLRPADSFPFAYFVGLIVMALNNKYKRLGDWAAGTMVVYLEDKKLNLVSQTKDILPPKFDLSTEEQLAIIQFFERSEELSQARQAELASILSAVLKAEGSEASDKLKAIARFYAGQEI